LEHRLDIDPLLRIYCETWSSKEDPGLLELERQTHLNTVKRLDASDKIQGRLISFISHLIKPQLIVEVGTFTAYATGCLAEGLAPGGKIISIEHNLILKETIENSLSHLGIRDKVDLKIGDAKIILPAIDEPIDLLFIDAAKYEYGTYYDTTIDQVRSGGVIIADNTLWKGRVLLTDKDRQSRRMHEFNVKVSQDDRVELFILPYRDGLTITKVNWFNLLSKKLN